MLDKLITYIVYLYKTLYQVLPVAWANRITTRGYIGSHNRLDLIQSLVLPHYVCNGYVSLFIPFLLAIVLFVFCLLAILLFVLIWFTVSDHPFGI
jgi:hypothetical protein